MEINSSEPEYFLFFSSYYRDITFKSLDKLLKYIDSEELFAYFPGIGNHIATDISEALLSLPKQNGSQRYKAGKYPSE